MGRLAYGNNDLYVTYGTTIERDDLNGNVLRSQTLPAGFNLEGVTVGSSDAPEPGSFASLAAGLFSLGVFKLVRVSRTRSRE